MHTTHTTRTPTISWSAVQRTGYFLQTIMFMSGRKKTRLRRRGLRWSKQSVFAEYPAYICM